MVTSQVFFIMVIIRVIYKCYFYGKRPKIVFRMDYLETLPKLRGRVIVFYGERVRSMVEEMKIFPAGDSSFTFFDCEKSVDAICPETRLLLVQYETRT